MPPSVAQRPLPPSNDKQEYEKKLAELEKRLQAEREKVLVASLKSQEEKTTAARVEVSIKELQDKLRRDRRDHEQEEHKLKLEQKAQELETRLAQERETWVTTLKSQLQARESQDKEIETHFAMRIQEMERRWLEEKAVWQKTALAKDEEARTLRALAEKLKGADNELSRVSAEKKLLDSRVAELLAERAEAQAKLGQAVEKEKESIQLRADLAVSRQQYAMAQERLEHDLQGLRASGHEREERLMSDIERLQRELSTIGERGRSEHEVEIRRIKAESDAELARHKETAERSSMELQRLRAVMGALERQSAASRAQLEELKRASGEWEKAQERYKAEFVGLQRKWVEREKEVRAEVAAQIREPLEAEKSLIKLQAQEEGHKVQAEREKELGSLRRDLADLRERLEKEEGRRKILSKENEEMERLVSAQAAQIRDSQEALERLRGKGPAA
jgi:hypothetical protein